MSCVSAYVPSVVVAISSCPPAAKQGVVERRVHATATGAKPSSAPQGVMKRAEARRVEVPLAYIQRPPLPSSSSSRWSVVDFVLVFESRWGEVACGIRSPGRLGGGEGVVVVVKRAGLGERGQEMIVAQGIIVIVRGRRLTSLPSSAADGFRSLSSALARSMRRVLVPLLLQTRRDLLQDVDLKQRCHVRHAPRRQEGFPHRRGRFVRALGRRDCEGEGGFRDVALWFQVKGAHFVVADAHAVDDGFGAQPADFEQVLEGGLVVGVTETVVVRRRRVPLFGDGVRV